MRAVVGVTDHDWASFLRRRPDLRGELLGAEGEDFGNGVDLYAREQAGEVIHLPVLEEDRPDRESLEWHMDEVFKSA